MSGLVRELRERKVFRTAMIYLVAAWGAVEVGSTVLPLLGLGEWAPRLVLAIVAAGFPVAVVFAWFFDIGPGGVSTEAGGRGVRISQAALLAAAVVVGLAIPTFLFLNRGSLESVQPVATTAVGAPAVPIALGSERTVAVLPFRTRGGEENAWFSDGVTDEIVLALARFDDLRVLSRRAAARLVEEGASPSEVGEALGARFILDGSVRRAEGRVRITAVLRETATDEIRWTDDFDRDLTVDDIFDVQRQVAEAVATELQARLGPARSAYLGLPPTQNLAAFDHYLRGNHALFRRTPASVTLAIAEHRTAAELDEDFAAAQAREAYGYALFIDWEWSYPGAGPDELLRRGTDLAAAALARDSMSADAWLATAYLQLMSHRDDPALALPAFQRSLALNPADPEAYHQYGQTLMSLGRYSEASIAYHGALALDPTRAMTLVPLSALASRTRNWPEARRWADSAIAVGPDVPYAWSVRGSLLNATGDHVGARADAEQAIRIDPSYSIPARAVLAVALWGLGDSIAAARELDRALGGLANPDAPGQTDALFIGGALVSMGRIEEALRIIESARPRSAWLWFYLQHPDFAPVHDEPRFRAVVEEADPRR